MNPAGGDFHLRTAPPISPAIDKGVNSYIHGTRQDTPSTTVPAEWVPGDDFETTARPQDGDADGTSSNDPGWDEVGAASVCGNGTVEAGEQCDDSNTTNGDCCSSNCLFEVGPCDDGNACTVGDFCASGSCLPGVGAPNCDDGNVCTDDSCDPGSGCVNAPNTAPCDVSLWRR